MVCWVGVGARVDWLRRRGLRTVVGRRDGILRAFFLYEEVCLVVVV